MLGSLIEIVLGVNRIVLFGVLGAVVLGGSMLLFFVFSGNGGSGGNVDLEQQIDFSAVDGNPGADPDQEGRGPGLLSESVIAERVAATVAAIVPTHTPVPTPTPDIAATLQAELAANRARSDRMLKLDPLSVRETRNPYLTGNEMDHLLGLGEALWDHTKAWLHMRELLALSLSDWSVSGAGFHISESARHLETYGDRDSRRYGRDRLGEVVATYTDTLEAGMAGVRQASLKLEQAWHVLSRSPSGLMVDLPFEDRERVAQLAREAESGLTEFDNAMSRYGCSVCGELFRLREDG